MAQRTVHYVFGQILAERCALDDAPRFLFGSLLPDAIRSKSERDASHYVFRGNDGTRYYDFERFRHDYSTRVPSDPLYLGYYMHLVEDNCYREFCHERYNFYFISEEEVHALHRDYHLLNPFLVQRYSLVDRLSLPSDFSEELLSHLANFDPAGLRADLTLDFSERPEGSFYLMRPEIMQEYIEITLPIAEAELRAVLRGEHHLHAADFAWKKEQA